MFNRKKMFSVLSAAMIISSIVLFTTGCDKGGGASNPVAPTGNGGIKGAVYQDSNVKLASTGRMENMNIWLVFSREAGALLRVSEAHASIDHSNSSPSSGILVELLLNGTVVASTITGPNGKFEFGGLSPGDYVLRFTKDPDLLITTTVNVKDGAMTEIEGKITLSSSGNSHLAMEIEEKREVDHHYEHEKKDSEKGHKDDGHKDDDDHDDDDHDDDDHDDDDHDDGDH